MQNIMSIEFSSALLDLKELNPSFDTGKLRIAYTGKNKNNTFISKESFEKAIPTMFNCPVVANYIREKDQIGSHDGEFVEDEETGKVEFISITQPVGIVPESAKWNWETVDDGGVIHQYLCTEVILWKRQEAYKKIKNEGITKQSMEILINDGEMHDDYYSINDFCFTAFCLLGNAEPCFESASLTTFSTNDFKEQYIEMMEEFKAAFSNAGNITAKEGERDLKLKELLEKYQLSEDQIDFEYDGLSDEELEAKFTEVYGGTEPDDKPDDEEKSERENNEFSYALTKQIRDTLTTVVEDEKVATDFGDFPRRFMVDFDLDKEEVYFIDYNDGYMYGCPFRFDGDDIIVDFEAAKRKKWIIDDYIEGENQETYSFDFKRMTSKITIKEVESPDKAELERLKKFEQDVLVERRTKLLEKFRSQLSDNEAFKALESNANNYTLEDLEKELYILVGKQNFSLKPNKVYINTAPFINPPEDGDQDNSEFGNLFNWKKNQ